MNSYESGKYINQGTYKSFQPALINRQWRVENMELQTLLSKADRFIGRLDMYSEHIPDIDIFISMHVTKEATKSSRIEGTQTNIEEALLERNDVSEDKRNDWDEVQNYIITLNTAISSLTDIPISTRLIKNTHNTLLQGVRGKHKQPGEFRKSQNWVGGATLNDAIYIPPVHTSINDLMSDLEKFAHNNDIFIPELVKIALLHYQFETIHPFLDGNGRVGRLLIPLYLVEKGILKKPVLYLSEFFEKHRSHYYDNLMIVREKSNITQWFKFFLVGIIETAENGVNTFDNILKLKTKTEEDIQQLGARAVSALKVIEYLYSRPIADAVKISEVSGLSMPSSYKLIADLQRIGILNEITGGQRKRIYAFEEYLKLF